MNGEKDDRLLLHKIPKEVLQIRITHAGGQAFGHQRDGGGFQLLDVGLLDGGFVTGHVLDDDAASVLRVHESHQDLA